MAAVSARTMYLLLACCIAFLFAGTGAYYFLSQGSKEEKLATATLPTPQPKSTPTPTIEPTPSTTAAPVTQQMASSSAVKTEYALVTDETKSVETPSTNLTTSCWDTCEYSYQCPDDLECMAVEGINRCVNPSCQESKTCTCSDAETELETYVQTPVETGVGGTTTLTQTASTSALSSTPAPNNQTLDDSPNLPKAGSGELTLAILAVGLSLAGIGYVWLR